jgi:hypothetical protein
MSADLTSTDALTACAEMLAVAKTAVARFPIKIHPVAAAALAFDQNQDGQTSLGEFLIGAERVFRRIDVDADGTSQQEIAAYRKQAAPPRRRTRSIRWSSKPAPCTLAYIFS